MLENERPSWRTSLLGNQTDRMVGIINIIWQLDYWSDSQTIGVVPLVLIYGHKNKINWITHKKSNGLILILCSSKPPILCNFI